MSFYPYKVIEVNDDDFNTHIYSIKSTMDGYSSNG